MPDFAKVRLGSRGFGVYGSFGVCVLAWTSRIPPGRVPHSERLYAEGSRSAGTGGVQWPRWFYCARGAFDGSIGSLIQNAAHLAVAFGRAFAVVHARAFFLSWACSHPRHEILRCGEGRRRGTYLGNDLLRRVHPQTGDLGQPLDCILMLAKEAGDLLVELPDLLLDQVQLLEPHPHQSAVDWVELGAGTQRVPQLCRRGVQALITQGG
jgi:hypothetical protein